jgi:hypothetical protein
VAYGARLESGLGVKALRGSNPLSSATIGRRRSRAAPFVVLADHAILGVMTTSTRLTGERRMAAFAGLTTLVLFAVLVPVTTVLDRRADRARPLYDDVLAIAQYEYEQVQEAGRPVALSLEAGGEDAATTGISLDEDTEYLGVTVDGTGYCIEAGNTFGDETGVLCFTGREKPASVLDERT